MAQRMMQEPHPMIEVYSPATLKKIGEVPVNSPVEVSIAVAAAREAFQVWSG